MIRDEWYMWAMMATAIILYIFVIFFAGCAADPPAPIEYYRQQYGFTPVR
jgi:hypothetical protein